MSHLDELDEFEAELEQLGVGVAPRELLVGAAELRHGRGKRDSGYPPQVEEALVLGAELVPAPVALGRDAPVLRQLGAVIEAENRLGVPHVDR